MLTLTKFEDLAAMLDLTKDSIDEYPSLKLLVSSVYAAIESYTGRTLELDSYTESIDVRNRLVPLKSFPVVSLTSVIADTDPNTNLADSCIKRNAHILLPNEVDSFVTVSYVGGYEEAPEPIKRASLLQVIHEWQRKDHLAADTVTNDGGSVTWPELGLLKEVKRLLDPFVHPMKYI